MVYANKTIFGILVYVHMFHKDCQIGEYLENCACIKSHVCNLINDETLDTMELKSIDSNDKKGYL